MPLFRSSRPLRVRVSVGIESCFMPSHGQGMRDVKGTFCMFFLVRMVFWFSLVLLFLPIDIGTPEGSPTASPLQTLLAAREAVGDLAGLCERKPDVCETGKAALQTIGVRAREGARIALEMLDGGSGTADPASITGGVPGAEQQVPAAERHVSAGEQKMPAAAQQE